MMLFLDLVLGGVFGFGLTYFLLQKQLSVAKFQAITLQKDIEMFEKNSEAFEVEKRKIIANEKEKYDAITKEKDRNFDDLRRAFDKQISDIKTDHKNSIENQKADYALAINEMKKAASEHFKNVANDILKKESTDLQKQGGETISNMLAPFKTEINNLNVSVANLLESGAKNAGLFEQQMKAVSQSSNTMMKATEDLTKALKGDKKMQGNWGEMVIKDIFHNAGLIEGRDYISQGIGMDLKNVDGSREQPDFIINIPDGKHIVVDSKVSLVNYEQYISTQDEQYLKLFLKNVQDQVKNLSGKKYNENKKLTAPDFTIMCIPIEPAYLLTVKADSALYTKALQEHKIFVCGPSNLIPVLHIVSNLWLRDSLNKGAREISDRAKSIFNKFSTFEKSLNIIGDSIRKADTAYSEACGQFMNGKDNLKGQLVKMNDLATKHGIEISEITVEDNTQLIEN
jgi:DNA recombination protein RmuC